MWISRMVTAYALIMMPRLRRKQYRTTRLEQRTPSNQNFRPINQTKSTAGYWIRDFQYLSTVDFPMLPWA